MFTGLELDFEICFDLLQQEQGHMQAVQATLKQARQRPDSNGRINLLIDVLAGQLGLNAARHL